MKEHTMGELVDLQTLHQKPDEIEIPPDGNSLDLLSIAEVIYP
jgi:hypothetical protein